MGLFTDKRIKARCAAAVCAGMMLFGVSACGASSDAGSNVDLQTQESRVDIGGAKDFSDEHNTAGTGTTDVLREASVQESMAQTAQNNTEHAVINGRRVYEDGQKIYLDRTWQYSGNSAINSGYAVMYKAAANRKDIIVGVNAGHGTNGGSSVKTWCHPDGSPKTTGGTTAAGAIEAVAVSGGMTGLPRARLHSIWRRYLSRSFLQRDMMCLCCGTVKMCSLTMSPEQLYVTMLQIVIYHFTGTVTDLIMIRAAFILRCRMRLRQWTRLPGYGKNMMCSEAALSARSGQRAQRLTEAAVCR